MPGADLEDLASRALCPLKDVMGRISEVTEVVSVNKLMPVPEALKMPNETTLL